MQIYLTFDYELFFGNKTGSAENCMLVPTNKLVLLAQKYNARLTFFVDVLYLIKLKEYSHVDKLNDEYKTILNHLKELIHQGHDIQLHLHTHWVNAKYENEWKLDYPNYRIHNFSEKEIEEIVHTSVNFLEEISQKKVFAFRAGGWCLQPFAKLRAAFVKHGVWLDSTVFYKGYNQSPTNLYDFRKSPDLDIWNFESDPLEVETYGHFTEVPISSSIVSPIFYAKTVVLKKMFPRKHQPIGDGEGIITRKAQVLRLLLTSTYKAVSCDGYKSSLLESVFNRHLSAGRNHLVIIGHPKFQSPYSFDKLESFMSDPSKQGHRFTSIGEVFGKVKSGVPEQFSY